MDIYVKNSLISIFSLFFWFTIMILSYTSILPMSQLQTQQVMTSQIRSHIEYVIQTYTVLVLILYFRLMRNVASLAVFLYHLMMILERGLLSWSTPYSRMSYVSR